MPILKTLIENNRKWAANLKETMPDFFEMLSKQQSPEYLWIGCSDSRVPATQLVGLLPGDMFVHRNVANLVIHTDLNCLSVLQFAVDVLKVKHIIVCGHYGCGGLKAALENQKHGLIDNWLRHVQDIIEKYESTLSRINDKETRLDRLCELNVFEQVLNVSSTTIVQDAWARGQELGVHGFVYRIQDGLLHEVNICIDNNKQLKMIRRNGVELIS